MTSEQGRKDSQVDSILKEKMHCWLHVAEIQRWKRGTGIESKVLSLEIRAGKIQLWASWARIIRVLEHNLITGQERLSGVKTRRITL